MTVNVGTVDRILRIILGIALIFAPLMNVPEIWSSATFAYTSIAVGLIVLATAFVRFCPIYRILGLSTCKI